MSRMLRVLLALIFIIGVIALGYQGNAWASKLASGTQNPVSSQQNKGLLLGSKQQAAPPTPTPEVLLTDQTVVAGDCGGGIMMVKTAPSQVNYRAYVVPVSSVPQPLPNMPITCAIKVLAITTTNLSSDTLVCWPILATTAGSAYYYNGSQWVQTLFLNADNQLCNNYVPGNAPNPLYVVVFSTEPTSAQIPVTGGIVVPPGGRPSGTVVTNPLQIPVTGQTSPLAGCTWVFSAIEAPPVGVNYAVHFVPETELPTPFPGILVSCPVKVTAVVSNNLGAKTLVCWPLLPVQAGFAYYYDGSKWVKTISHIADNQICADVVSDTAPNPAYVAVFDR